MYQNTTVLFVLVVFSLTCSVHDVYRWICEERWYKAEYCLHRLLFVLKKTSPTRTELTQHTQSSDRLCVHLLVFLTQTATCRKPEKINEGGNKETADSTVCVCVSACHMHLLQQSIINTDKEQKRTGKNPHGHIFNQLPHHIAPLLCCISNNTIISTSSIC